jgi:hypothetical protein
MGEGDYGPRSGEALDYTRKEIASGKLALGISPERMVGSFVRGSSYLGTTNADQKRALVFNWSLADIAKASGSAHSRTPATLPGSC